MYENLIYRLREDLVGPAHNYWQLMRNADGAIERLTKDLEDCRNELCQMCCHNMNRHLSVCDGCRWNSNKEGT